MAVYDLILLVDPTASEERRAEIPEQVTSMIREDGRVLGVQDWGTRRMGFRINHREEAAYHLIQFEGPPALLERLRHSLRIAEGVLRFRTIRLKAGAASAPEPGGEAQPERQEPEGGQVAARAAADA